MPKLSQLIEMFISFSSNLTPTDLWIVYSLMLLAVLYVAYRTMGIGGLLGIMIIFFFAYVLYDHDAFKTYLSKENAESSHMKEIEREMK